MIKLVKYGSRYQFLKDGYPPSKPVDIKQLKVILTSTDSLYSAVGTYLSSLGLPPPSPVEKARLRSQRRKLLQLLLNKPSEEEWQVDLTTPIVGWKVLYLVRKHWLVSLYDRSQWSPLTPKKARCKLFVHSQPPYSDCTCGIYLLDKRDDLIRHISNFDITRITTRVSGWGRYVRAEFGWLVQYAYPLEFYLTEKQAVPDIVDVLTQFRVPILVPVGRYDKIYDPQEDGYELPVGSVNVNIRD